MINIIPEPLYFERLENPFSLGKTIYLSFSNDSDTQHPLKFFAGYIQDFFTNFLYIECEIKTEYSENREIEIIENTEIIEIKMVLNEEQLRTKFEKIHPLLDQFSRSSDEAYYLSMSRSTIEIIGKSYKGIFYAIQSLLWYINSYDLNGETLTMDSFKIFDVPRFQWRGLLLDEARHFQGAEAVKQILDIMAFLKLNTFHWHLTDDQGWRLEIKKYPKLIEIGSKRDNTQKGGYLSRKTTGKPHQGHYTQAQIKDIIEYARKRAITVVPEIDIPGHCMSALAAYPELSCTGKNVSVPTRFGIKKDVFCPGKEEVFEFLENVLDEIIDLFPSEIIHIGGDEVPKTRWKNCEACQKRITEEGLKNEKELQAYFTNRIHQYLKSKDKKTMGWNEITEADIDKGIIVQFWMKRLENTLKHIRKGGEAVMSRFSRVYLNKDYVVIPQKRCYFYDPIPKELEKEFHSNILGTEACLWGEFIRNANRRNYMLFPRLAAFSETAWTLKGNKNYSRYQKKLDNFLKYLKGKNIPYADLSKVDPCVLKRIFVPILLLKEPKVPIDKA